MKKPESIKIFLVDDDPLYLTRLEIEFLQHPGYEVEVYTTAEHCMENLGRGPDVIVLDYQLNSVENTAMDGLQALDKIKNYDSRIPVIMLSSDDKVEVANKCIQHQAFEFVVKSETVFVRLQQIIRTITRFKKIESELNWYMDRM